MNYKTDITNYSNRELSLIVFNTERLYNMIDDFRGLKILINTIKDEYIYTPDQFDDLIVSIKCYQDDSIIYN